MGTSVELDASDSPPACRSANGGGLSATATTVLTFLAVFLIQNTQNRDGLAIQLKLDELIRAVGAARNRLVNLEDCTTKSWRRYTQSSSDFRRANVVRQQAPSSRRATKT